MASNRLIQKPIQEITSPFGSYMQLEDRSNLQLSPCPYFGISSLQTRRTRAIPRAWIATIYNAKIHQPSFAVTSGDYLWQLDRETELPYFSAGYSAEFDIGTGGTIRFKRERNSVAQIDRALLLGGRVSYSYFHHTFEYLPRLEILNRFPEYKNLPLLADARLDAQARDMLRAAVGTSRHIIWPEPETDIVAEQLVTVASPTYLPDDPALDLEAAAVDPRAVEWLADTFVKTDSKLNNEAIVWITRRNYAEQAKIDGYHVRDIENSLEIDGFFKDLGAKIHSPESLTFAQQRDVFANADMVCMAAGSAVTNLIFCRPGTKIIIISQNNHVNPGLLIGIAQACRLNICWVFGLGVPSNRPPVHWSFLVDPLNIRRGIQYLSGASVQPDGMIAFE